MPSSLFPVSTIAVGALVFAVGAGTAALAQPALGYYTRDQAESGGAVYQKQCASCHGQDMEGYVGPPLRGHAFQVIASRQGTVDRLLLVISSNEPQNNPGSLSEEDAGSVLAFILAANGYPAGNVKLSAGSPNLRALPLDR